MASSTADEKSSQKAMGRRFSDMRNQQFEYQISHKNDESRTKLFQQQLSAVIITKALILGPLERMKVVLQVKHLAKFLNPSDCPKNALDLSNKIINDQGLLAYYRGMNAMVYKQAIEFSLKFGLYETAFQHLRSSSGVDYSFGQSLGAATFTALLTTTLTYPLDFAHGRMAADLSKKPSVYIEKTEMSINNKARLYSSVRDCLQQAQTERGLGRMAKAGNVFRGYQSALLGQVPYTAVLLSTFELLEQASDSIDTKFNRKDGLPVYYKMAVRFGSSTLALLLAQTLCYPFDTVKRRMQLNGAKGHKNLYRNDLDCFRKIMSEEGGVRGLYVGFSVNLVRCLPMVVLQYIVFKSFRVFSQRKETARVKAKGY